MVDIDELHDAAGDGSGRPSSSSIAHRRSHEIIDVTMKWSRNGYAETLLHAMSPAGEPATGTQGLEARRAKRSSALGDPARVVLARDGSGLSRYDYVTAEALAAASHRDLDESDACRTVSFDAARRRRQRHAGESDERHPGRRPRVGEDRNAVERAHAVRLRHDDRRRAAGRFRSWSTTSACRRRRSMRSSIRRWCGWWSFTGSSAFGGRWPVQARVLTGRLAADLASETETRETGERSAGLLVPRFRATRTVRRSSPSSSRPRRRRARRQGPRETASRRRP